MRTGVTPTTKTVSASLPLQREGNSRRIAELEPHAGRARLELHVGDNGEIGGGVGAAGVADAGGHEARAEAAPQLNVAVVVRVYMRGESENEWRVSE